MLALNFIVNLESEKSAAFPAYLLLAARDLSLARLDIAFITTANSLYYKNMEKKIKKDAISLGRRVGLPFIYAPLLLVCSVGTVPR